MKKTPKLGRPNKYDFSVIRKGRWVSIQSDNILSCRESARYYATLKGWDIITKADGDKLLIYRL